MNLNQNPELVELRKAVREFTNKEIKPIARQIDESGEIPKELIKKMGEQGLLGLYFPEEYGGSGFGKIGYCIALEEITRGSGSVATMVGAHQSIGTNALFIGGSEDLKKKYMPALTSGKKIAAFALTEPEAGSDVMSIRTTAKLEGDHYIVNGTKMWITNGEIADYLSLFVKTEKGIACLFVDAKSEGITVHPREKKLGIRGSVTNMISFDNVKVPKENLIGQEGRGFIIAMKTLEGGRLTIGACSVGAGKELLELSANYALQRKQFGKTISNYQAIQFMLAEMKVEIYAMESMLYRVAAKFEEGLDATEEASLLKLFSSESICKVADLALQIHGGMGFSAELPIERFYRDARILRIFEGTSEIQKSLIAHRIIKNKGVWNL